MATSSPLTPTEAALVDTVRLALTSSPNSIRQFVRRLAKNPPTDVNRVELQAQLSELLASAPPDTSSPLRRSQPAEGLPAPMPPRSVGARRGDGANLIDTGSGGGRSTSRPVADEFSEVHQWHPAKDPVSNRPVWSPATEACLAELIRQQHSTALLAEHGLSPATKVMFVGPPGVGKTMTATFLASELAVPLVVIDPTVIMSSYLGNSAKNLRAVMEQARHEECVVFFDEFDAIAKSRDDSNDIGEVKRLVNSLLLELDRSHRSLVIAATNYDQALDPAIHRRFDTRIEFSLPGPAERRRLIARHPALLSFGVTDLVVDLLTLATHEWSPSDIERHLNALTRSAILASDGADPIVAIAEWGVEYLNNPGADPDTRREVASVAVNVMHYSHRQAADLLGVTHPTISKWLKSA